jgi:hypothetical protein
MKKTTQTKTDKTAKKNVLNLVPGDLDGVCGGVGIVVQ